MEEVALLTQTVMVELTPTPTVTPPQAPEITQSHTQILARVNQPTRVEQIRPGVLREEAVLLPITRDLLQLQELQEELLTLLQRASLRVISPNLFLNIFHKSGGF